MAPTDAAPPPFRVAGHGDVDGLVALVESAYRGEASRAGWTTEADLLDGRRTDAEALRHALDRTDGVVLVAEADGAPVACCHLTRHGDGAHVGMVAVRPTRQGGGLGRAVLDEAARQAVGRWGARSLRMTVIRQRTELIAWYRRRGFEPTGETEPFPYGDERFGRPRRDDLEFVVLARPLPEEPPPVRTG